MKIDSKEWENSILENTLQTYFESMHYASLQIDSFDNFIHHRLKKIMEEESVLEVNINSKEKFRVVFGHIFVDKPYIIDENRKIKYISPQEARLREINYSGMISVNMKTSKIIQTATGEDVEIDVKYHLRKIIAKIPIMVQSSKCFLHNKSEKEKEYYGECPYDKGGYFIIKGKERVLVSQERMNHNIVYVFDQKSSQKFKMIAEIRSMSEETRHSVFVQMKILGKKIVLQIPFIQQEIPLGIVFRAYGLTESEVKSILEINCPRTKTNYQFQTYLEGILLDVERIGSKENAISYICDFSINTVMKERRTKYVEQLLHNELFPHLGICSTKINKTLFLGYMLNRLMLTFIGDRKLDDRDHINNKRIEMSGYLLSELFRTLFKRFIRTIEPQLEKRQDIIVITNRFNMITVGINHCFATGNWGIPKSNYIRTGVSQILNRLSYNSFISHLNRILVQIGKEGKNTKVRQIHPSQIGFICAHETPEGPQSGIVKNLNTLVKLTSFTSSVFIREVLEECKFLNMDIENWFQEHLQDSSNEVLGKVFLNGHLIGMTEDLSSVISFLHKKKDHDIIPIDVSISHSEMEQELHIFSDEGRMIRPFFPANNFPTPNDIKTKSFLTLVQEKKIIYLDSYQIEHEVIAMTKNEMEANSYYTCCEIHPSIICGFSVSLIPFVEHTQSPRVTYHAAMGKQAIGIPFTTISIRPDTMQHLMYYPQRPIVQSHIAEYNKCNDLPFGSNLVVAIAMYTGFNQEDSVIMSRGAIERGLFRSFYYKSLIVEEKKRCTISSESICHVPTMYQVRNFDYSKLNNDGIVKVGSYVGVGDVIVGKLQKNLSKNTVEEWKDNSTIIKSGEEGFVDSVFATTTPDGYRIVKIKIRNLKIPEIGDKLASRSAQKGTIAMILNEEDMPYTESGIIPDLIINPLCIPSRMTINQLIECLGAKLSIDQGKYCYCTAFSNYSQDIIPFFSQELKNRGFNEHGNETMYNGMTGQKLECSIFIGPTYYHRLKHLVSSKIHARNHGSLQALTRQPLEGRSRDGGLRFGEMERDCEHYTVPVSLHCGLSVKIGEMGNKGWKVLGWCKKEKKIVSGLQTGFLCKGKRDCIQLTFNDGRTKICTPNHLLLTEAETWNAAETTLGKKLKTSVVYPVVEFQKDVKLCKNWTMNIGEICLETNLLETFLKSMAFMRIIGLFCSNGKFERSLQKKGELVPIISLQYLADKKILDEDLKYFTGNKHEHKQWKKNETQNRFEVQLPQILTKNLSSILHFSAEKEINSLPAFVLDKTFPTPLLREFLAALFGGDGGQTCHFTKQQEFSTSICFSRLSLENDKFMKQLQTLLKRCGIEKTLLYISNKTTASLRRHEIILELEKSEMTSFYQKIGFRYSCLKSLQLEAGVSYERARNIVKKQYEWIMDRVGILTDSKKYVSIENAIREAKTELHEKEAIFHEKAVPKEQDFTNRFMKRTEFDSFPTAKEFLTEIKTLEWFDDNYVLQSNQRGLPTMDLKVVDIRPVGKQLVYDIEVDKIHTFLANGIVAHNCMISHGVSRFLREKLFDVSDYFEYYICNDCGFAPHKESICNICHGKNIQKIAIPYACKLLFQQLNAMGLKTSIFCKELLNKL